MEGEEEASSVWAGSFEPPLLSEADKAKLAAQQLVDDFKRRKLELEARKNWDRFYKDRNWSHQDLRAVCKDIDFQSLVFLEAGCGVGNMLFPMAETFPHWTFQGFDFSDNAVRMLKERADSLRVQVETAVIDLTEPSTSNFSTKADLCTLIFVLSALHPEKHAQAIRNLHNFVKPGGTVLVRDYGMNDYAMVRFGRGAKLGERFYARQDGTRAYYFDLDELCSQFEREGFNCVSREYLHRRTVNYQKGLDVARVFVQARFTSGQL